MRNVPELRFDGFDVEWESSYLKELASIYDGTHQTPNYTNSGVKFLSVENIKDLKATKFISEEDFKKNFKVFPEFNDILMTRIGSVGITNVIKSNEKFAYYVTLALFKTNNRIYPEFLNYSINSRNVQNEIWKRTLHVAFPNKINMNEIGEIPLKYPAWEEQEKIGDLFKKIDDLIEIQEGKVSKMEDFKKSMLQKMFPKKDELVPEFRFDGFDGEWGSTKLSYISNRVTRRNLENQSKLPLTISSELGLVNQLDYYNNRVASKDISNYYLIMNGEFAYNKSTSLTAPYGAIKRLDYYENGALSTLYIVFEIVNNDLDFMKYYFETSLWHKEIYKVSQEGARNHGLLNIATDDFFSMKLKIPNLEEQEKIGNFFKNLDGQIEAEEKLLESYKMMKKSLLQKMFV